MDGKSVKLRILVWFEVIVAARILLFTFPVLLNKYMNGSSLTGYEEKFINILSLTAVFYFICGVSALLGNRQWRIYHYLVTLAVCALSFPFLNAVGKVPEFCYYLLPAAVSVLLSLGLIAARGRTV